MVFPFFKNNRGQGNAIEYAVVFFMVVAIVSGMSTYAKRSIQARVRGARNYMWVQVNGVYNQAITGEPMPVEYEPYYVKTKSIKEEQTTQTEGVTTWPGHEGVYQTGINSVVTTTTDSEVLPANNALINMDDPDLPIID